MRKQRKRKLKERENRRSKLERRFVSVTSVPIDADVIRREIKYIVERAKNRDARCVTLGVLVFVSTETGDAWLLDAADSLALCLARDGMAQAVHIVESETQFGIEWDRKFSIDGDSFCTVERDRGRVATVIGYPTRSILEALARASG